MAPYDWRIDITKIPQAKRNHFFPPVAPEPDPFSDDNAVIDSDSDQSLSSAMSNPFSDKNVVDEPEPHERSVSKMGMSNEQPENTNQQPEDNNQQPSDVLEPHTPHVQATPDASTSALPTAPFTVASMRLRDHCSEEQCHHLVGLFVSAQYATSFIEHICQTYFPGRRCDVREVEKTPFYRHIPVKQRVESRLLVAESQADRRTIYAQLEHCDRIIREPAKLVQMGNTRGLVLGSAEA